MRIHVSEALIKAIDFIEENLTEKINVKNMADAAGYSVFHFSRQFNSLTGHSPYDYLMRRRMSESAFDILEDKTNFTDIAFKYQFGNYETFSRGFHKMFECSPSEFRNTQRVHLLQWKRRFSVDYLNHLNTYNYKCPEYVMLEEQLIAGTIVSDRHFIENGKSMMKNSGNTSYIHMQREHRHLHEYAFMKGHGIMGTIISDVMDAQPEWVCKALPYSRYLKFDYAGSYFQIQNVYTYIFETWFPQAGLNVDVSYVLEKIDHDNTHIQIYVPVPDYS